MTPPAAAAPARVRTPLRTPPPRRVSGPVRRPARSGGAVVVPLPARAAGAARRLPDLPLLDRLVRGRLWIGFVAVALMGIVFLQVSLLGLNAGISRDVATIERLERETSLLRADVARLGGTDRVTATAVRLGMSAPVAGSVAFVDTRVDVAKAAAELTAPDPVAWQAGLAADLQRAGVVTPAPGEAITAQASDASAAITAQASDASAASAPVAEQPAPVAQPAPAPAPAPAAQPASQPVPPAQPQATPASAPAAGGTAAPEG